MSDWKKYLQKAGGIRLLKQYFQNHTIWTAINQFLILGRDKKSLEILRLSIESKLQKRIDTKYRKIAHDFAKTYCNKGNSCVPIKKIWICWWQGIENAPELVQKCYTSVQRHFSDWDITIITQNNYHEFVTFPDYILEKWRNGIVSNTHMSDLLRLELLINHGGFWLDSTVFCTSNDIPSSILNSNLFFYQCLKPGADGHTVILSSWLIYSQCDNRILKLTRDLLYHYWTTHNHLREYFLLHHFIILSCEVFENDYRKVPQFCNSIPHILLLNLFNKFDPTYWKDLCRMSCFHKLSYKLDNDLVVNSQDTYYSQIINDSIYEIPLK